MASYWLIIAIILGGFFTLLNNKRKFVNHFYKNLSNDQLAKETMLILNKILKLHNKESYFTYTKIDSYTDLEDIISKYNELLSKKNFKTIFDLRNEFAPTGLFQELSIQNGWTEAYKELLYKFGIIHNIFCERLKNTS